MYIESGNFFDIVNIAPLYHWNGGNYLLFYYRLFLEILYFVLRTIFIAHSLINMQLEVCVRARACVTQTEDSVTSERERILK
jgi:phosphotransferase system  glucose/maltose/N-acetylglucosamine-specific IIC component